MMGIGPVHLAKICLVVLVSVTVGCGATIEPGAVQEFNKAQSEFDAAKGKDDFLRVAQMYDRIAQSGVRSGVVLYNQGNAFMRAGYRGRAIACYRQAKRYRPRDPLLDANLRSALESAGANAAASRPGKPLIEYFLFWQDWISYPGKFKLSFWFAAMTLAFGTASLFLRPGIWKQIAAGWLVVTLIMSGSALYDWYRFEQQLYGVITRSGVVARKGDAESYEAAFTEPLSEGTEFSVLERRRDWVRIQLAGTQEGWVPASDAVVY